MFRRYMKTEEPQRRVYEGNVYHSAPQYPNVSININHHPTATSSTASTSPYQVSTVRTSPPSSAPPPPPAPPAPRNTLPANPTYHAIPNRNSNYAYPHESIWFDKFVRRENRGMLRLCLIELFLAAVVLGGGIWCARDTPEYCPYYSAIWTSTIFLINAVIGIVAAKTGIHNTYIAHLILSILCIFLCIISSVLAFRNWTLIGTYHHPKVSRDTAFCLLGEHDATRLSYIFTNMDQYDFKTCLFALKLGVGVNSVQFLVAALLGLLNVFSVIFCLRRVCRRNIITTISNLKRHRTPADGYLEETALSGGGLGTALELEQGPPVKKAAVNPIFQSSYNEMPSLSLVQPNLLLSAMSQANTMTQAGIMPMTLGGFPPALLPSNVLLPPLSYTFQNNLVSSPYSNYPALLTQPSVSSSLTFDGTPLLSFQAPDIKVDPSSLYNVFVGDLGQDVDNNCLLNAFKKFGQIAEAKVIRDAQSMKSRGYGFVTFWKQEDAQKSIDEMNGQIVGKRAIRTNWATRKNNENKRSTTYEEVLSACDGENTSVYLGNIGPEVSESDVREAFSKFGTIRQIRMFSPKNYAFVVFDTKENAAKAIHEFGGQELRGHMITCSWGKLSDQVPKTNPLLVFANMNRLIQPQMNAISQLYSPFVPNWH